MGTLYLVATPIGNLEDMSPRAVRILGSVRLIAAEDTRVTRKLLTHFSIHTPLASYHEHNKLLKLDQVLGELDKGDVALVSDAGTPAINDPGYELVRASLEKGHIVCPIPGPSAPLAALAASGHPTDAFLYLGYLPRKTTERRNFLDEVKDHPYTLILLESPHRLLAALGDMHITLGDRHIAIARELTKLHEQIWRGTLQEAQRYFTSIEPRGEFTLVVAGKPPQQDNFWSEEQVMVAVKLGLKLGEAPSTLAKRLAEESGWNRKELSSIIMENKQNHS